MFIISLLIDRFRSFTRILSSILTLYKFKNNYYINSKKEEEERLKLFHLNYKNHRYFDTKQLFSTSLMWAYKFMKKETRLQVPSFSTFLKENHDLLKLWCEEVSEPLEDRIIFPLRILRFATYFFLLFLIVVALIDP